MSYKDTNITELELSLRAIDAIKKWLPEVKTAGDLNTVSDGELLRMPNFGKKSLKEVKEVLATMFGDLNNVKESSPEKNPMKKISQDFTYNIIDHASDAASKSLDVILKKEEWSYDDIDKYFTAHQKIMFTYRQSLQRLNESYND